MRTDVVRPLAIAAAAAALLSCAAAGAAPSPSLSGVVLDTSCEVLPGVTLTLRSGSIQRRVVTGSRGEFSFTDLADARYALEARLQGFRTLQQDAVRGSDTAAPVTLLLPVK